MSEVAADTRTLVHVAGPAELQTFGRRERWTIRCLRCDLILSIAIVKTGLAEFGTGRRVLEDSAEHGTPIFQDGGPYAPAGNGQLDCCYDED